MNPRHTPILVAGLTAALFVVGLAGGCDEQKPVRSYTIVKDQEPPQPPPPITWTLPAGWTSFNDGNPMRYATIRTSADAGGIELTVSRLEGSGGGLDQNINRWMGQVGLDAKGVDLTKHFERRDGKSGAYVVADLTGTIRDNATGQLRRIIGAVLMDSQSLWFVKADGPADKLEPFKADITRFTDSIDFASPAPRSIAAQTPDTTEPPRPAPTPPPFIAAPRTDPSPGARDASLPTWQVPEGWEVGPPSQFSAASFLVQKGEASARVTVTLLPHPPFAEAQESRWLLENINRWRTQTRLAPAADLEGTGAQKSAIGGMTAWAVDLAPPDTEFGPDPDAARILGVIIVRGIDSVFIKMTGPSGLVGEQKATFTQFVQSFKFDRKD